MKRQEEMLSMIDAEHPIPVVRDIARWFVCGYTNDWAYQAQLLDGAALAPALMDELRDLWPAATDEDIRRGLDLAIAASKHSP
jgi:hypothetical protein